MENSHPDSLTDNQVSPLDQEIETTLRPGSFDEYIGQAQVKEGLDIAIKACLMRGEPLDHTLIYGVSGLGKTTLALIIASVMGRQIHITSGPAIERPADLVSILTNLEKGDIIFIDEIHRLSRVVEEVLYSAMEDFRIDLVLGKGPAARSLRLELPPFTLIGATTKIASLSAPLRSRFGNLYKLDFYEEEDIQKIIERSAKILSVTLDPESSQIIARSSRRTPRIANRLLKRVRDFAAVTSGGTITASVAKDAMERLSIDELGLDEVDRKILTTLIERFKGGPVGLKTIAAAIAEEADTIEDVYEPYLLRLGLLERTAKGRVASKAAYLHLNLTEPPSNQSLL